MTTRELDRGETEVIGSVLAAVRPQFPPFVRDAVFELRADHTGDPGVWIWLILDDDTELESRAIQLELRRVRRMIEDGVFRSGINLWPYVHVRTQSEQRDRSTRGVA